jgi:hypothetical protein
LYVDQSCEIKPRYRSIGFAAFVAVQNTVHLPPCAGASELSVPVRLLCSGWSNKACVSSQFARSCSRLQVIEPTVDRQKSRRSIPTQSAMPDASARCTDRPGSTGGQRHRRALEGRELHELAVETAARTAVVIAVAARLLYVPAS